MEYIGGVVERITFMNEENGYGVIKIKSKGFSELLTVVGSLGAVNVGSTLRIKGEWRVDAKYGRQFCAVDYRETVPATAAGIEKYLGSGLIKGIGPAFAKRIVAKYGTDTLRIIEEEPEALIHVEGIGTKRVESIIKAWQDQKEIKNVMLFLQSHEVSTAFAVKIFKTYGKDSIQLVQENPYRLADDIWGIGFKTADKIARKMGFDTQSYQRSRSGLMYTLNALADEGHCYALRSQLLEAANVLLEIEMPLLDESINKMLEEQALISQTDGVPEKGSEALYLPPFFFSESGTAKQIARLASWNEGEVLSLQPVDQLLDEIQKTNGIVYDSIQIEAIKKALASRFLVLTGGPGTGKTTTTLGIIKAFKHMGRRVLLAAPTGRAAKRLSEATGMEAKTLHRLLEYKPPEGYQKNEDNPLSCDVLIVDETSMVDILLMYNLMKAVPEGAAVILVGDVDQLPSVGAGNVLKDIISSGVVEVVRLTRIFRQAQNSTIITNAHRINRGEMPVMKGGAGSDFFFIEQEEPQKLVETVRDLCLKRLPGYYRVNPLTDIHVLCPMQRGDTGAQNLNLVLQEALNPSQVTIKYGGRVYRLNDKVMQIKNNYDKNVFNGDIGSIIRIDEEDKTLVIRFDTGEVEYDATELDEVTLAYATTVHKSQGSEYPIVVAPFTMQHYVMLQRNLLYTCVTRAKKVFVLVGSKKAVALAVKNNKLSDRNTLLASRLALRMKK